MRLIRRLVFAILLATRVFLGVIRPHIIALTSIGHERELYDVGLPEIDIGINIILAKAGYRQAW